MRCFISIILIVRVVSGSNAGINLEDLPDGFDHAMTHRRAHVNLPRFSKKGKATPDYYDYYYEQEWTWEKKGDKKSKHDKKVKKDSKKDKKWKDYGKLAQTRKPTPSPIHLPTLTPNSTNDSESESQSEDMRPTSENSEDCPRTYNIFFKIAGLTLKTFVKVVKIILKFLCSRSSPVCDTSFSKYNYEQKAYDETCAVP